MEKCIKAMLVGKMDKDNRIIYVFRNVNNEDHETNLIMCTQSPNWCCEDVNLFQLGFVSLINVKAGIDTYFSRQHMQRFPYQYDGTYFLNFVPVTHVLENGFVTKPQTITIS